MAKRILVLGIVILVIICAPALACPEAPKPTVEVLNEFSVAEPSQEMSDAELQAAGPSMPIPDALIFLVGKKRTFGMTNRKISPSHLELRANVSPPDDLGNVCVTVTSLRFKVSVSNQIYINPIYLPETCPYNVALTHEKKHVEISRGIYKKYLRLLEEQLPQALVGFEVKSIPVSEIDSYKSSLNRKVFSITNPMMITMDQEMVTENSKLDTYEERRSNTKSCPEFEDLQ